MKEYKIIVNFEDNTIETDLNKLVQNDYNSIKINFEIDKKYDSALFELKYPKNKGTLQLLVVNNEIILPRGTLFVSGDYEFEISIYTSDSKLTHFMTKTFEVREELVTDSEDIINDDRYPVLSDLIGKVNKAISGVEVFKNEIKNDENLRGPQGIPGKSYDDAEIKKRLSKIEDVLFLKATANVSIANNVVTLTIKSNKVLQEMEEFTLSSDKKSLSKVLAENVGGEVTITSVDGQELTLTYEAAPEITISISNQNEDGTTNKTNQPVTVTLTSNKEVQPIEGWDMSEDKKTLLKYEEEIQTNLQITIYDLSGNSITLTYSILNVDTKPPYIKTTSSAIKAKVLSNGNIQVTIQADISRILNSDWKNKTSGVFTKEYTVEELTNGVEEYIAMKDSFDNIGVEKVNMSYVNETFTATHEVIEHNEHTYGENIEVYEAIANKTHNHIIKQICSICKYENIISSISESCTDSELQNLETDEEHCYIHVKTCTKCNQETYRDAPEHHESSTCDSVGDIHCTECGKVLRNIGPVLPPIPDLPLEDE